MAEDSRPSSPLPLRPAAYTRLPGAPVSTPLTRYWQLGRRLCHVSGQLCGLLAGALTAKAQSSSGIAPRLLRRIARHMDPQLAALPFAAQLRLRLERLGPTYIKLGQIMAVREDLLPSALTDELKNLFDQAPAAPFAAIRALIEVELDQPLERLFATVEEQPLGSASLAQAHRATTHDGETVVIKVLKPGVRATVLADLTLLHGLGVVLDQLLPQYQPAAIIAEFHAYTVRELDLSLEADHDELFAACFQDNPAIVFPRPRRALSSVSVLTMSYLPGFKPGTPETAALNAAQRARVVDLGAEAILRMLYQYGLFHADLHAGNLLILPGPPLRVGFIDLGMVGRFEDVTRRRLLYYYHALVGGDATMAAMHLAAIAQPGPGGDPAAFRRAVSELSQRFLLRAASGEFSIARLILESMRLGGRYRMYFRVELVLMVKALVTFEGVGRMVDPELDVVAVSRAHIGPILRAQLRPERLARELLRNGPELLDLAGRLPELLAHSGRLLDGAGAVSRATPLAGLRGAIVAAACILGGVLVLLQSEAWLAGGGLLLAGFWCYRRGA